MKKLWAIRTIGKNHAALGVNTVILCNTRQEARDAKKRQKNVYRIVGMEDSDLKITMHRAVEGSSGMVGIYSSVEY